MTRDEIIRLAREAGYIASPIYLRVELFANLVAAAEREACARVCEEIEMQGHALWKRTYDPDAQGRSTGAADCAAAIRARGEQEQTR